MTNDLDCCYECGRRDCPDFIAGNAPSKRSVVAELEKLSDATGEGAMSASEYIKRLRSL